ncbi:MAG: 2-iminoacetate synthase ThiH [Oscillospiraceae bacterium]|jgi:2-iminoacetate synthase|nr:2-iminoacetate synthase ThiH [Oscillospiraceae bacterium]
MKQISYNPLEYQPGMEEIQSDLLSHVLKSVNNFHAEEYSAEAVKRAIASPHRSIKDFAALLSPEAEHHLEEMAQAAKALTRRWFGNSIQLFTPLYIANYCENACTYCGFGCRNKIHRAKLSFDEIEREAEAIAKTGLRELLVLTGECRGASGVEYIGKSLELLKGYFGVLGIEIYPLNAEEYRYLQRCGADYVSVYQETYDLNRYAQVHPAGPKRCFPYRFHAQERALLGGMRGVAFGALLGLGEFRHDAFAAGLHAYFLQEKYPHAEISFSFPRLRPFQEAPGRKQDAGGPPPPPVTERRLLQIMLAYRLFLPFCGITISTRERAGFRDAVAGMVATKLSAGVSVGVGGHGEAQKGDPQFMIADGRSVAQVREMLENQGLQAVMIDYVRL